MSSSSNKNKTEQWIAIPRDVYDDFVKQKAVNVRLQAQLHHHMKYRPYSTPETQSQSTEEKTGAVLIK